MLMWFSCAFLYLTTQLCLTATMENESDCLSEYPCFAFDDTDEMISFTKQNIDMFAVVQNLQVFLTMSGIKIAFIGGNFERTWELFFAGIAASRTPKTKAHIITTKAAGAAMDGYSDLKVHTILEKESLEDIGDLISTMDVVVLGVGLDIQDVYLLKLIAKVTDICRAEKKAIIVTDGGIDILLKNVTLLKDYPTPGAIIIAEYGSALELEEIISSFSDRDDYWYKYWGEHVSILAGDQFFSHADTCVWSVQRKQFRYVTGESQVLSGLLSFIYATMLKSHICARRYKYQFIQSIASLATIRFLEYTNTNAYKRHQDSTQAIDIIAELDRTFIHFQRSF